MAGKGSKPGSNNGGGRKPGTPNKKTIEMAAIAAAQIDAARASGKPLAKDVLQKMMEIAEGATGLHKPQQGTDGRIIDGTGDWPLFGEWFDRTVYCAKELAKYQSPTFKAVAVYAPGQHTPGDDAKPTPGTVIDMNDPQVITRAYLRMVKAS